MSTGNEALGAKPLDLLAMEGAIMALRPSACPHVETTPIPWLNPEGIIGVMLCCAKCGAEVKFVALSEDGGP